MKGVTDSGAFERQVNALLKQMDETFDGLSKKEAVKFLKYALSYPYEHTKYELKTHRQIQVADFINQLEHAKGNLLATFMAEEAEKAAKEQTKQKELSEEEIEETDGSIGPKEQCEGCEECTCNKGEE